MNDQYSMYNHNSPYSQKKKDPFFEEKDSYGNEKLRVNICPKIFVLIDPSALPALWAAVLYDILQHAL